MTVAEQGGDVALDPARADRDRGLPREDRRELDVAQAERDLVALVEHLEDADRAVLVDERDRDDAPRHVAGLAGERPPEPGIALDVRQGERLAGRVDVADEALDGGTDSPTTPWPCSPAATRNTSRSVAGVVQRDRGGFGLEERDRRVDDRAQDRLGRAEIEAPGGLGAEGDGPQRGDGVGPQAVLGLVGHRRRPAVAAGSVERPLTARRRGRGARCWG